MQGIEVDTTGTAELDEPALVEGLPGVGHVGKLAAEHIVDELGGEVVRRVYAEQFPPQVTVDDDGRTTLAGVAVHAVPTEGRDLLVLTGDYQPQDAGGHYRVTGTVLEVADELGVESVYALGGVPTGELVEEYAVVGAATTDTMVDTLADAGVEFRPEEPAGGIVGISGLLLGLGERKGVPAACLMGETSGYLVDPKSAQAVLAVLEELLGFEVGFDELEARAEEMEEVVGKLQEMDDTGGVPAEDDLHYIG